MTPLALACAMAAAGSAAPAGRTVQVSGHGVDLLNGALVHSEERTPTGLRRQSTEIVELEGDLHGRVLYQVATLIDDTAHTLVNTGEQVYSGTVAGSAPVLLRDDQFRFEVNLASGAEHGRVYLVHHLAGPPVRCTLDVTGSGRDAAGNPTFSYRGSCTFAAAAAGASSSSSRPQT